MKDSKHLSVSLPIKNNNNNNNNNSEKSKSSLSIPRLSIPQKPHQKITISLVIPAYTGDFPEDTQPSDVLPTIHEKLFGLNALPKDTISCQKISESNFGFTLNESKLDFDEINRIYKDNLTKQDEISTLAKSLMTLENERLRLNQEVNFWKNKYLLEKQSKSRGIHLSLPKLSSNLSFSTSTSSTETFKINTDAPDPLPQGKGSPPPNLKSSVTRSSLGENQNPTPYGAPTLFVNDYLSLGQSENVLQIHHLSGKNVFTPRPRSKSLPQRFSKKTTSCAECSQCPYFYPIPQTPWVCHFCKHTSLKHKKALQF